MPAGTVLSRRVVNQCGGFEVVLRDCGNACSELGSWPIGGLEAGSRITERATDQYQSSRRPSLICSVSPFFVFSLSCGLYLCFLLSFLPVSLFSNGIRSDASSVSSFLLFESFHHRMHSFSMCVFFFCFHLFQLTFLFCRQASISIFFLMLTFCDWYFHFDPKH